MAGRIQEGLCSIREVIPRPHAQRGSYCLKCCLLCLKYCPAALAPSACPHPPGALAMGGPTPSLQLLSDRRPWEKAMVFPPEMSPPLLLWLRELAEGVCRAPSPTSMGRWEAGRGGKLPVRHLPQAREG